MNSRQVLEQNSPRKRWNISLESAPAWSAIIGLIIAILLGVLVKAGPIVWLVYYLGSFAVGIFLYQRYPILYVGFAWWLWFVGPSVKRLIDYQNGFVMPGAWQLMPALVTSISFATFVRYLPRFHKQGGFPFILGIGVVFYALIIQLIQEPITLRNITNFLFSLSPILFGFHLFVNWRHYPIYRQNLQRVFLWGILVMGIYGIWQFFMPPPWDTWWTNQVGFCSCYNNRLWSTMRDPFVFGAFLSAGLPLLITNQSALKVPVAVIGCLCLLLTLVRSAWLSLVLALFLLFPSLKARFQKRLIVTTLMVIIFSLPLTRIESVSETISPKLESFSELESDGSFQARANTYNQSLIDAAMVEFVGKGLGFNGREFEGDQSFYSNDTGFLSLLFSLGWFGTIPYLSAIALLLSKLFYFPKNNLDLFINTLRSIVVSILLLGLIGLGGVIKQEGMMIVWGFLGVAVAGCKYYQSQSNSKPNRSNL